MLGKCDTRLRVSWLTTQAGADMVTVVHCTKLELTVIQIAVNTGQEENNKQLKS